MSTLPRRARGDVIRTALLVAGARALADVPSSAQWGRDVVHAAIRALPPGSVVVTGDARGPDEWARDSARFLGVAVRVYTKHGRVIDAAGAVTSRWRDPAGAPQPPETWRDRLLARDAAEVAAVAGLVSDDFGWRAAVVALHAPWATTRGTAYTVARARDAGLHVDEHTCPAAHAPRGPR